MWQWSINVWPTVWLTYFSKGSNNWLSGTYQYVMSWITRKTYFHAMYLMLIYVNTNLMYNFERKTFVSILIS